MGLLDIFSKKSAGPKLIPLPKGSFTIDRNGRVLTTTLPRNFPKDLINEIGTASLSVFQNAQRAQIALTQYSFTFASFKITAKELRGGAIIFLSPKH